MSVLVIQFITNTRLLIPGTANVGVRGQVLEIGPGKPGVNFPYRSPIDQKTHYGEQKYVLLRYLDDVGDDEEHEDIDVRLDGGPSVIDINDAATGPTGVHKVMSERGKTIPDENPPKEEEEKPKKKRTVRRPRLTRSSKESGSTDKKDKKNTRKK